MNYLLYGEDTYRSRKKMQEIVEAYRQKIGSALGIYYIDMEEDDTLKLQAHTDTYSLFLNKKLVVVQYPLHTREAALLRCVFEKTKTLQDIVVILWNPAIEKKQEKEFSELLNLMDKAQEFTLLTGARLRVWIEGEAKRRCIAVSARQRLMLESYGGNLWKIANELEKLAVYPASAVVEEASRETTIFQLGDAVFGNSVQALRILLALFQEGHDEMAIWAYLANYTRTLLMIKDRVDTGKQVPKEWGIHPFVVKKSSLLVQRIDTQKLQKLIERFYDEDRKIKIGLTTPRESLMNLIAT